ncbi:beta family protein [Rhizorhapis suberifaciens]|uniref:Beta protein n=1 Tax=Rhizorhapis suberifaciens TaxID=13656 RepID=A0A840HWG4_9SPHN|nr:hypothetical protein [Rhizorhapis suberifaciens]MBB4641957.1 hypothetical protein [Rhizorhapis suberifaciens]
MLEGRRYVPLLHARLAEMRALRELPSGTKNLIFPVIRVRPWLNAKYLSKVFDVISDSLGERGYGLDLDASKRNPDIDKPAYREFVGLFNSARGYSAYYDCVAEAPNRIPVLRREGHQTLELQHQLNRVGNLERGLVVRVEANNPGDYSQVAENCFARNLENVVFVIDCGWRIDVLQQSSNCTSIVNEILEINDAFEIVVAGSSFPHAFNGMGPKRKFAVNERVLFQNVRRNVNKGRLYYGDWGSTRPPTDPVPMTNVPRIDIADRSDWTAFRSDNGETYPDIAERITDDPDWDGDTGLWGNYMIKSTAEGLDPAIRAPAMAAAVRVNIHMHMQAHFDDPDGIEVVDEPVGEDL